MAPPFRELLYTKPYTFIIGADKHEISVHSGVIAALSASLDRLINGPMKEGQSGRVYFPELEVEDFERICEFAYSNDYSIPDSVEISCSPDREKVLSVFCTSAMRKPTTHSDTYAGHNSSELYESVCETTEQSSKKNKRRTHSDAFMPPQQPRCNSSWKEDFTPVFLAHARLYAFASMHMIQNLKTLAFEKLDKTLELFTLYNSGCISVINLARFAYNRDQIGDRDEKTRKVNELRRLVVRFIADRAKYFSKFAAHDELLVNEGEYSRDLVNALVIQKW